MWASISSDDHLCILRQNASATHPPPACGGGLGGHGHSAFTQKWDKLHASLHDTATPEQSPDPTTEGMDTPAPHDGEEIDFIASICNQFDVDLETLYAHAAKCCTEANKERHMHWKPPKGSTLPPGDIRCMMADKKEIDINGTKYSAKTANATSHASDVTIDGVTYSTSMAKFSVPMCSDIFSPMATYHVSALQHSNKMGSLIDRGANGDIAGAGCHVIKETHCFINVKGIDNHFMQKHPIVTAGGVTNSNKGPIILIMNQYALSGKGMSIHSSLQMEWYNVNIDNRSMKVATVIT